ncbi:MAG: serine/threonine-protein kinase [Actinophytocola sp.]|uniref:serine/threonine-protein kinase n=1 Tax=Actinophytocola sp. TaxID=1872138 RepID=UPI003D6B32CC
MQDQPGQGDRTAARNSGPGWSGPAPRQLGPHDPPEVGGYRIRAVLGDGGMGKVYLAETTDGRPLAVKVVRHEYADDPAFRRRFEQEVATARRVHGAHTAPVIDAGTQAAQPWLATEYVPGPPLQYAVGAHGPLPVQRALTLVAEVAEALQSIHAAGVVHRDLKPSNVILSPDGPKVIDFGIARAADTTSVTKTGMRTGTPAYMSPEHVRGEEVTPAADVFALGVLANYAASGELAFGGGTDPGVAYRILEQEPKLANCPELVRPIVLRCLEKDPLRRPSTAEVRELCLAAAAAAEPPTVRTDAVSNTSWTTPVLNLGQPESWDRPARRWKQPRFALAGAAAAVAIALVVGLLLFTDPPPGDANPAADAAADSSTEPTNTESGGAASPGTPESSTSRGDEPSTTVTADNQSDSALELTFDVAPIEGYRIGDSAVIGPAQTIDVRSVDAGSSSLAAWVEVYRPGSFDPSDALDGEPITAGDRTGFYDPAAFAGDGGPPKPSAILTYDDDAWFLVQSDLQGAAARDLVQKVAESVRIGTRRALRFPVQLSVPFELGPCGAWDGLDPARLNPGPRLSLLYLCDAQVPDWSDPQGSHAISISMDADRSTLEQYAPPNTKIGGRPARVEEGSGIPPSVIVDFDDFVLTIAVSDTHVGDYEAGALRKIAEGVTVRDYADESTWFAGTEVLGRS